MKPLALLVDDEPVIVELMENVLHEDFDCVVATNVTEALVAIQIEPAVAVVDKNLPDGSGVAIITALKRRWPLTEVMMLTGYATAQTRAEALRLGAFAYVTKPMPDILELRTMLLEAAARRERRRTNPPIDDGDA